MNYETPSAVAKLKIDNLANSVFLTNEMIKSTQSDAKQSKPITKFRLTGNLVKGQRYIGLLNGSDK
jgi:hypothetical protein